MALARKCDVCGEFYDRYNEIGNEPNGFTLTKTTHDRQRINKEKLDCCPDCMEYLWDFINSRRPPKESENDG